MPPDSGPLAYHVTPRGAKLHRAGFPHTLLQPGEHVCGVVMDGHPLTPRRAYQITQKLWKQLNRFASYPQTGVSLRQMVQFGRQANQGTVFLAASFLLGA